MLFPPVYRWKNQAYDDSIANRDYVCKNVRSSQAHKYLLAQGFSHQSRENQVIVFVSLFFFYSSSLTDYFIFYINSIFVYSYQRKDNEGGMICTVSVDLDGNPDIRMEQSCKLIILMLIYNKEEKKKDKGASSFVQSRLG